LILVHNTSSNLFLDEVSVTPRLLELAEHLPLLLRQHADSLFLLLAESLLQIVAIIIFLSFPSGLHDELLPQSFDFRLELLHRVHIGAVFVFMLVNDNLLLGLLGSDVTNEAVLGHDMVLQAGLLELRHLSTEYHVVVGTAGDLERHSRLIG